MTEDPMAEDRMLAAYVDGELEPEAQRDVEALIGRDQGAGHRIQVIAFLNHLLKATYAKEERHPPSHPKYTRRYLRSWAD